MQCNERQNASRGALIPETPLGARSLPSSGECWGPTRRHRQAEQCSSDLAKVIVQLCDGGRSWTASQPQLPQKTRPAGSPVEP